MINHWQIEDILARFDISDNEIISLLAQLDRMRLIELQPGNRVRLLVENNFRWQVDGPIERYFTSQVQREFFNSNFSEAGAMRIVKNGVLSKKAQLELRTRIAMVNDLFDELTEQERKVPLDDRHGVTMIMAIRDWSPTLFADLERQ